MIKLLLKRKAYFLILLFSVASFQLFSQNLDIEILKELNLNRNQSLDRFFQIISSTVGLITYSFPALLLGYAIWKKKLVLKYKAYYMGSSIILAALIANIIKHSVDRPRPFKTYDFIEKLSSGGSPSFPSGHTTDAFVLATTLTIIFPRWYVIIPAFIWAGIVGYSRMSLGVHYPSDITVGIVLGILSAFVVYHFFKKKAWL